MKKPKTKYNQTKAIEGLILTTLLLTILIPTTLCTKKLLTINQHQTLKTNLATLRITILETALKHPPVRRSLGEGGTPTTHIYPTEITPHIFHNKRLPIEPITNQYTIHITTQNAITNTGGWIYNPNTGKIKPNLEKYKNL